MKHNILSLVIACGFMASCASTGEDKPLGTFYTSYEALQGKEHSNSKFFYSEYRTETIDNEYLVSEVTIFSDNEVDLEFGLKSNAKLTISYSNGNFSDVEIRMSEGQTNCTDYDELFNQYLCDVRIKFFPRDESKKVQQKRGSYRSLSSYNGYYLGPLEKAYFKDRVFKAKALWLELPIHGNGNKLFKFDLSGIEPPVGMRKPIESDTQEDSE